MVRVSFWQGEFGDYGETFGCLSPLLYRGRFTAVIGEAIRKWGEGMLELAGSLIRELDAALKENDRLQERVAELERRAALDSTNSSKPPATDGPGKKRGRNKRTESERSRSGKPSGGQPGHKGTTLRQTGIPDRVVDHDPTACSGCGAPLSASDRKGTPARRQVFDLPEPCPLEVTEHRAHSCRCPGCDTLTRAAFPDHVRGPVQYGRRITGMVAYLQHAQLLPEKRLGELMADLFGVKISKATIAAMAARTAKRFEGLNAHLTRVLRSRVAVKHLDETPVRIDGGQSWFHVLSTPLLAVLRLGTGRGDVGRDFNGILVHDAFASYFSLEGVRHAPCHAHHLRELKALARLDGEPWAQKMRALLRRARKAAASARDNGREVPDDVRANISCEWDGILDEAIAFHESQPPLDSARPDRPKRRRGHNCARRLKKHKAEALRFLYDSRVPFTNNEAERDLRMLKLRQKISGGFRTDEGARCFATLRTVILTARKQGWNILDTLAHPDPNQLIPTLRIDPTPPQPVASSA